MKRNIKVREQELIDRLNNALHPQKKEYQAPCATSVGVDTADGQDRTAILRWDNNGPVQFEEEKCEEPRSRTYEEVNHPQHYNNYDVEVIDMMEKIFGREETAIFCKLNAFKYRMRAGTKPNQSAEKDLAKEQWYLRKKNELQP